MSRRPFIIKAGDLVSVNFNNSQWTLCSRGIVHWVPVATGDSWIIEDVSNNQTHYISEGCTISLVEKDYLKAAGQEDDSGSE